MSLPMPDFPDESVLCLLAQTTSNRRLVLLLGCFTYFLRHRQDSPTKFLANKLGLLLQPFASGIAELDGVIAAGRLLFESFTMRHVFHHSEDTQRFLHALHDIDIDGQPFEAVVQQMQQLFLATLPQQKKWSLTRYLKELRKAKQHLLVHTNAEPCTTRPQELDPLHNRKRKASTQAGSDAGPTKETRPNRRTTNASDLETEEEEDGSIERTPMQIEAVLCKPTGIFLPPKELRGQPCLRAHPTAEWEPLPWDVRRQLHEDDDAWILPVQEMLPPVLLQAMEEEDQRLPTWRQDVEWAFGCHMPVRHLNAFFAEEQVEGSVSHRGQGNQGRCLLLKRLGLLERQPAREQARRHLEERHAMELQGASFNAVQSNLYGGEVVHPCGSSALDHCGWHKDGLCKRRGPPIAGGCYARLAEPEDERASGEGRERGFAALLIQREASPHVQAWIPHTHGTGYLLGGSECHTKYFHAKHLFGRWPSTSYHVSFTYSVYEPFRLNSLTPSGADVRVDWRAPALCRLWNRFLFVGPVAKDSCHPHLLALNAGLLADNALGSTRYHAYWQPWDQFRNAAVLQLLHLHPNGRGAGIAGKRVAVSILIGADGSYPDAVRLKVRGGRGRLRVRYAASSRGLPLLQASFSERIALRAFLCPSHPARSLFGGDQQTILMLPPLHICKRKDVEGVSHFILEAWLSEVDMCVVK